MPFYFSNLILQFAIIKKHLTNEREDAFLVKISLAFL